MPWVTESSVITARQPPSTFKRVNRRSLTTRLAALHRRRLTLTDSSAAIVERYAYSAYGVPTITNAAGTLLPVGSVDNSYLPMGPWVDYPAASCECLRESARIWNQVRVPLHSFGCNSNTVLRCMGGRCGISIPGGGKGMGFDKCKNYNCLRWSGQDDCGGLPGKLDCASRKCEEWRDFCDFWFRHGAAGTQPEVPDGQYQTPGA